MLTSKDNTVSLSLCLYVADPATLLASNSVFFPPLRTACLFTCERLYYYLINIMNIKILSVNFIFKTTQCPWKIKTVVP